MEENNIEADKSFASSTKVKKYIELMYRKSSELNHIEDLDSRKERACELAKLPIDSYGVQRLINMENPYANELLFEFLTRENPNDYVNLIANQQLLNDLQKKKMFDKANDLKSSKDADDLLKRVKDGYAAVYKDDKIIEIAEEKIRRMRPEERVMKKKVKVE